MYSAHNFTVQYVYSVISSHNMIHIPAVPRSAPHGRHACHLEKHCVTELTYGVQNAFVSDCESDRKDNNVKPLPRTLNMILP